MEKKLELLLQEIQPIDSHFHYFSALEQNLPAEDQLSFAFQNGLQAAIEAGTSEYDFEMRRKLSQRYPYLYLLAGYHPHWWQKHHEMPDEKSLIDEITYEKTVAVGEIGLDYADNMDKIQQQKLFEWQLSLAKNYAKPVVLHVRDAHEDALAIIKNSGINKGVVHCFTGDIKIARAWLNLNFTLSFSGIVTFKKAETVQESAIFCPMDKLLCETDAPYLAPIPYRGLSNQLGYVVYIYQEIARLKKLSLQEISEKISINFSNLMMSTCR